MSPGRYVLGARPRRCRCHGNFGGMQGPALSQNRRCRHHPIESGVLDGKSSRPAGAAVRRFKDWPQPDKEIKTAGMRGGRHPGRPRQLGVDSPRPLVTSAGQLWWVLVRAGLSEMHVQIMSEFSVDLTRNIKKYNCNETMFAGHQP